MAGLIDVRGLSYRYEDHGPEVLRKVDFELEAGEAVALFGTNGSGKTTFVLHLNGLLTAAGHHGGGSITVCGMDLTKENLPAIRRKIGLVFQDSDSQLFMPTVLEDVAFGLLNQGMEARRAEDRAKTALRQVGMESAANRAPYHLSAGEKKRVAIAGILAMEPEILILDEPTTYLDPPGQRSLAELLRVLPQAKIVVTHDAGFAKSVCTRAVFFENGTIVADGPVSAIVDQFDWDFTPAHRGPAPECGPTR